MQNLYFIACNIMIVGTFFLSTELIIIEANTSDRVKWFSLKLQEWETICLYFFIQKRACLCTITIMYVTPV